MGYGSQLTAQTANIIMVSSAHKQLIHLIPLAVEIYFQYVAQTPASHLVISIFQSS